MHTAESCLLCPGSSGGPSMCNGQCRWEYTSNKCVDFDFEITPPGKTFLDQNKILRTSNFLRKNKECAFLRLVLYTITGPSCEDKHKSCNGWARLGECINNPAYMLTNCKKSCNQCGGNILFVI